MKEVILAIESSCDETAVAILVDGLLKANVISSQVEMHAKYGGVMPEMASRLHTENITLVLQEALIKAEIKLEDVTHFAVTRGPGLIGALHVGLQAAKTLAALYQKPLIPVNHLAAHIYANEFITPLKFPLLAVVVSGGNTELVYMKKHLDFEVIGATEDDAVGECFDKVARVLGLPYPGGVPIDQRAKLGQDTYSLPRPLAHKGLNFSYSGLKTAVINLVHNAEQKGEEIRINDLCTSFQKTAIGLIIEKVTAAISLYPVQQIVLAGGVSANSYLREQITLLGKAKKIEIIIPPLWATTDNAAMIAILAKRLIKEGIHADLSLGAEAGWQIEDFAHF